jgi:hypothetical protein
LSEMHGTFPQAEELKETDPAELNLAPSGQP